MTRPLVVQDRAGRGEPYPAVHQPADAVRELRPGAVRQGRLPPAARRHQRLRPAALGQRGGVRLLCKQLHPPAYEFTGWGRPVCRCQTTASLRTHMHLSFSKDVDYPRGQLYGQLGRLAEVPYRFKLRSRLLPPMSSSGSVCHSLQAELGAGRHQWRPVHRGLRDEPQQAADHRRQCAPGRSRCAAKRAPCSVAYI